jgi:hypothetical protein
MLRVYAHVIPEEESDLSFVDFLSPERPYPAPLVEKDFVEDKAASANPLAALEKLARPAPRRARSCAPCGWPKPPSAGNH